MGFSSDVQDLPKLLYDTRKKRGLTLDDHLADWLHGEAYRSAARAYKMFTFSRLEGLPFTIENSQISFKGKVFFKLSSVNGDILSSLAEHLLRERRVRLGNYGCEVKGVWYARGNYFKINTYNLYFTLPDYFSKLNL